MVLQELWVADIDDECILGLDFLQSHNFLVDIKDGALTMGGEIIPLNKPPPSPDPACYKAEGVHLPPLLEAIVSVTIHQTTANGQWGLLEWSEAPTRLLVARTLVDLQEEASLLLIYLSSHG